MDYTEGDFQVEHAAALVGGDVQFDFELNLRCPAISRLIRSGAAEYAVHLECAPTSYRELIRGPHASFRHVVYADRLLGNVERVALILAKEDITEYDGGGDFSSDFAGLKCFVPRGGILAYCALPAAYLESQLAADTSGPSIFVAYKLPESGAPPMRVEFDQDSIMIGLSAENYARYGQMAADAGMQPILNSMLVLPAMIYVLDALSDPEILGDSRHREWFRTISRSAAEIGKDLESWVRGDSDTGVSTIEMAQMLMDSPLGRALAEANRMSFDPMEDEDT